MQKLVEDFDFQQKYGQDYTEPQNNTEDKRSLLYKQGEELGMIAYS